MPNPRELARVPLGVVERRAVQRAPRVDFPPHLYPPTGAHEFVLYATDTLDNITTVVTPAGLALQLPAGTLGFVRNITLYVGNLLESSDITWQVLVNGLPAEGYGALSVFPRAASAVSRDYEASIALPIEAAVSVRIRSSDGGTYRVGAELKGWYYTAGDEALS